MARMNAKEQQKFFIVAAVIAAAVGVYAEMSYQEKQKDAAELQKLRALPYPAGTRDPRE
jgi:hypothetical protein